MKPIPEGEIEWKQAHQWEYNISNGGPAACQSQELGRETECWRSIETNLHCGCGTWLFHHSCHLIDPSLLLSPDWSVTAPVTWLINHCSCHLIGQSLLLPPDWSITAPVTWLIRHCSCHLTDPSLILSPDWSITAPVTADNSFIIYGHLCWRVPCSQLPSWVRTFTPTCRVCDLGCWKVGSFRGWELERLGDTLRSFKTEVGGWEAERLGNPEVGSLKGWEFERLGVWEFGSFKGWEVVRLRSRKAERLGGWEVWELGGFEIVRLKDWELGSLNLTVNSQAPSVPRCNNDWMPAQLCTLVCSGVDMRIICTALQLRSRPDGI